MEVTGQLYAPADLSLEKESLVPIEQEARWAPDSVWMLWRRGKEIPSLSHPIFE
jgi:hypothetical protein